MDINNVLFAWVPGNTNAYTIFDKETGKNWYGNETKEDLLKTYHNMRFLEYEDFEKEIAKIMVTPPIEISKDDFMCALGVLPPERWTNMGDFEFFVMAEYTSGIYTNVYARYKKRYFVFCDSAYIHPNEIQKKVLDFLG